MMGFIREENIDIAAPPEAVFDYVSDFSRHPEWADQKMEMTTGPGPAVPGKKFSTVVEFMGKVPGTGEVIESTRPSRLVYDCTDSGGKFRWTFEITPTAAGSHLLHRNERLSAPLYVKLLQGPLMWPLIGKKMVGNGLAKIKANVEQQVGAQS